MATYSRRERTTTRVEFVLPADEPWGACWVEIMKAIHAIHAELHAADPTRYPEGRDVPDDTIRLFPRDGSILVTYEKDVRDG